VADEPEQTTPVVLNRRAVIAALVGIVAVVVLLAAIRVVGGSRENQASPAPTPAPKNDAGALPGIISTVPPSVVSAVGAGTAAPLQARRLPALAKDGKPLVLVVSSGRCADCAAERWALVAALGRFGTFENVELTTSSETGAYPNTPTFGFDGARFRSSYLAFDAVDSQQMTHEQRRVFERYDTEALTGRPKGSLPFLAIGGRFVLAGAQFDPGVVADQAARAVASAVQHPATDQAMGVIGAANQLTAAFCSLTGDQPTATCKLPLIQRLEQAQKRAAA
jgi:Domain of unknown function (DUF929)